MKFFGKVSLVFKYISRLFRLDPWYFMLSFFSQICNAAAAMLMLWLPKIILDEFVGDRNITKIIICVAIMAVSAIFICVVEKITETLGFRLSHLQNHVRIERASKRWRSSTWRRWNLPPYMTCRLSRRRSTTAEQ